MDATLIMTSSSQHIKQKLLLVISAALLASFSCSASFKTYEAALDESKWVFDGNPLNCKLSHNIPFYGDAKFEKNAGRQKQLEFKLGYKRHAIGKNKVATVRSLAPSWQPQQTGRQLGEVKLTSGSNIISSQNMASWRLLNELEVGRFPTFFYQDFNQLEDQISVSLSSVGFQFEYDKFLNCLTTLVQFELNELTKMTFFFDFDRSSVKTKYQSKLDALAAYIKFDPSIEVVFINGYTDSKGSRYYNENLANRRIASVKKRLSLEGVDDNRFKTRAFGEKNPVASNRNAKGRAKNRRVYIKIAQR